MGLIASANMSVFLVPSLCLPYNIVVGGKAMVHALAVARPATALCLSGSVLVMLDQTKKPRSTSGLSPRHLATKVRFAGRRGPAPSLEHTFSQNSGAQFSCGGDCPVRSGIVLTYKSSKTAAGRFEGDRLPSGRSRPPLQVGAADAAKTSPTEVDPFSHTVQSQPRSREGNPRSYSLMEV